MTGLPMLMKLLGGGAAAATAGGAGLGLASKLGIAGVASWAGLKAAKAAGLPDTNAPGHPQRSVVESICLAACR